MLTAILLGLLLIICVSNSVILWRFYLQYDRWLQMITWFDQNFWHPAADSTRAYEQWKQEQQARAPSSNG